MRPDATACIFCGRALFGGKNYCPHCGKGIYYPVTEQSKCLACGQGLHLSASSQIETSTKEILEDQPTGFANPLTAETVHVSPISIAHRFTMVGLVILGVGILHKILLPISTSLTLGLENCFSTGWFGWGHWGGLLSSGDPWFTLCFIVAVICFVIALSTRKPGRERQSTTSRDFFVNLCRTLLFIMVGIGFVAGGCGAVHDMIRADKTATPFSFDIETKHSVTDMYSIYKKLEYQNMESDILFVGIIILVLLVILQFGFTVWLAIDAPKHGERGLVWALLSLCFNFLLVVPIYFLFFRTNGKIPCKYCGIWFQPMGRNCLIVARIWNDYTASVACEKNDDVRYLCLCRDFPAVPTDSYPADLLV